MIQDRPADLTAIAHVLTHDHLVADYGTRSHKKDSTIRIASLRARCASHTLSV